MLEYIQHEVYSSLRLVQVNSDCALFCITNKERREKKIVPVKWGNGSIDSFDKHFLDLSTCCPHQPSPLQSGFSIYLNISHGHRSFQRSRKWVWTHLATSKNFWPENKWEILTVNKGGKRFHFTDPAKAAWQVIASAKRDYANRWKMSIRFSRMQCIYIWQYPANCPIATCHLQSSTSLLSMAYFKDWSRCLAILQYLEIAKGCKYTQLIEDSNRQTRQWVPIQIPRILRKKCRSKEHQSCDFVVLIFQHFT
jgi:hypothetical protein